MNTVQQEAQTAAELRDRDGLTTREIAAQTGMSQTKVVNRLKLYDTGPQPALRRAKRNMLPFVLLVFSLLILATAAIALVFMRTTRPVAITPAVLCIRSNGHTIIGLSPVRHGSCPTGWTLMNLTPQK